MSFRANASTALPGHVVVCSPHFDVGVRTLLTASVDDWGAKNPGKKMDGLTDRADGLYMQRGEIDMMVIERQQGGKAKVLAREEIDDECGPPAEFLIGCRACRTRRGARVNAPSGEASTNGARCSLAMPRRAGGRRAGGRRL
jgi:hypothetical protein